MVVYVVIEVFVVWLCLCIDYCYDGWLLGSGMVEFYDVGVISCFNGVCMLNIDVSGLIYNLCLWGMLLGVLCVG